MEFMENAIKSTWKSVGEVNMKNSAKTAYDLRIHDSYWEKKSKSRSFLEFFIFHIYAFKLRVKVINVLLIINEPNRNLFKKQKKKCYFFFGMDKQISSMLFYSKCLFLRSILLLAKLSQFNEFLSDIWHAEIGR